MSVDRDIRKSYRNRQGMSYKSLHEYGFSGMENTTAVEVLLTPKKKSELQSARVMDRIVSESIDPDGNSDEELEDLRKILKGTEDGRQKEEDKLVMKRQKEEEKAGLRKQIEENQHTLPITIDILLKIYNHIDLSDVKHAVIWCLFLFAFFFLMARTSNLVPDSVHQFDSSKQLTREEIVLNGDIVIYVYILFIYYIFSMF